MIKKSKIPANYQTVMTYLILKNAEEFIAFTKNIFNATETTKVMRDKSIIMHAEIMVGESTIMLADSTEGYEPRTAGLFVYVDDADSTYTKAVDAGSAIITPLSDQPYGRSGGILDPFGNTWWITSVI